MKASLKIQIMAGELETLAQDKARKGEIEDAETYRAAAVALLTSLLKVAK